MSRVLLQYVIPLVLPTTLYLIWWAAFGRRRTAVSSAPSRLTEGPWFWLAIAGFVLMAAGLIYTALSTGEPPGARYMAPFLKDGRVVPGHFVRDSDGG